MTADAVEGVAVAVVGGGAAGILAAIRLLDVLGAADRVEVVEPQGLLGAGIAFATDDPHHLLNIPAMMMSAYEDQPEHFASYLSQQGKGTATTFAPRFVYGEYLRATLARAVQSSAAAFTHRQQTAVRLQPGTGGDGVAIELDNGETVSTDFAVLAVGWGSPNPVRAPSRQVAIKPWSREGDLAISRYAGASQPIVVIGTGLSAADIVGTLARQGCTSIVAVSPSGTFPAAHPASLQWPDTGPTVARIAEASRASDLIHRTRAACAGGEQWQRVIDGLRGYLPAVWNNMSEVERARLVRHVLPVWEKLRHRMPPHTTRTIAELQANDTLSILRGRVTEHDAGRLVVETPSGPKTLNPVLTIDCTGWSRDPRRMGRGLISQLIDDGFATAHGPAIDLTADGRVAGPLHTRLWATGLLIGDQVWENSGVALLRRQAARVADSLREAAHAEGAR
ncbi:FAD/NAD(P)-binding protein [Microbacterium rhizomatis]|uniref:FAD-dependent urate hydroxylase HpyO/Asp monooxygenase CreE-like FAD/NAD(P)-binding domain-containing protein n=1 Tax=Microbacterium rhizomatis TaxID=1631477 RepID=A0A5J5J0L2_9MICO|nr:FAD/NAD(P)-binding protein [Microbacterium rhizomatis]KAA9107524.1 hypothetical protein F6B43_08600 [Microbacterium rhizomatis]